MTKASHFEKANFSVSNTEGKYGMLTFVSLISFILN